VTKDGTKIPLDEKKVGIFFFLVFVQNSFALKFILVQAEVDGAKFFFFFLQKSLNFCRDNLYEQRIR
jgi:hypothetical protein